MPKKRNASDTAASPVNAAATAKKSAAGKATATKRSPDPTVGARPATAGKHVKDAPKRPTSTAQASSSTSRRSRTKAPRARKRKRRGPAAPRAKPAAPLTTDDAFSLAFGEGTTIAARLVSTAPPPRIRIGDAMRRSGLDEYKVARTFAGVVDKLSDGTKDTGGVQKLLVDVLKECSRHLDPPQSERAAPAAPAQIIMVHNVPRPVHTQTPQQQLNAAPATDVAEPSAAPVSEPGATPSS